MPAPWDATQMIRNFTYLGMNDKRQWVRISAHAGGLVENIIQSIAGDILWMGLTRAVRHGLDVIVHVHDEIVVETEKARAEETLKLLIKLMTDVPAWALDLWLGAAGVITDIYTKD